MRISPTYYPTLLPLLPTTTMQQIKKRNKTLLGMYWQILEISCSDARQLTPLKYLLAFWARFPSCSSLESGVTTRGWPLDICMQVCKAEKKLLIQISPCHWASSNIGRNPGDLRKESTKYIASSRGKFYAHRELHRKNSTFCAPQSKSLTLCLWASHEQSRWSIN